MDDAIGEAREALKTGDAGRIRRAREALTAASTTIASARGRQAAGSAAPGGEGAGPTGPGGAVDAEFEDVDDEHRRRAG